MPLWLFTDQYALVVPNTIQNIVIAMAVMIFIALLLIPQPSCAFWVTFAIASIDIGVIGFMTLWNVNLVNFLKLFKNRCFLNYRISSDSSPASINSPCWRLFEK
jgi:hypothetical protein